MTEKLNPRWESYIEVTTQPKNWEFMFFIKIMLKRYGKLYLTPDCLGYYHIDNHDKFTQFVKEEIKKDKKNILFELQSI